MGPGRDLGYSKMLTSKGRGCGMDRDVEDLIQSLFMTSSRLFPWSGRNWLVDSRHRPDRRGDVTFRAGFVQPVVDRNQFTVRPLHCPCIADVWFARAAACPNPGTSYSFLAMLEPAVVTC
jgi:hypothetical protein